MDDPVKIQITTSGNDKPSTKQIFEQISADMEWTLKLNKLIAKIKKSSYDEYLAEGFSEEQAMFLIK